MMAEPEPEPPQASASSEPEPTSEPEFTDTVQWILVVIAVIFIIVGTIGNSLVILTIVRMTNRSITEIFLTSLAVADLLVCIACIPLLIVGITVHSGHTGFSYILEQQIFYSSSVASILNLTAVAIDRHDVIMNPMNRKITVKRCKYVLVAVWAISLLVAVVIYFIPSKYEWILLGLFLFTPLYLMIHCYVKVLKKAKESAEKVLSEKSNGGATKKKGRVDKTVRMVVVIVVMFCVSWIPSLIVRFLKYTIDIEDLLLAVLEISSCLVAYGGSSLNFLVYAFMSRKFKNTMMQMFFKRGKVMPFRNTAGLSMLQTDI
ncbi:prolactin-releasing peptide receptor-like [Antedon mediterranea]|uniref:prolactin-releasing peptide receptor-like n=1 Tax=Antedon mediterranea TaxID=105859 RepID=UPI003AF4E5DE